MNTPYFKNINWTYWLLFHILIWLLYGGIYLNDLMNTDKPNDYWKYIVFTTTIASIICIPLHLIFSWMHEKHIISKIIIAAIACVIFASVWSLIKYSFYNHFFEGRLSTVSLISYRSIMHNLNPLLMWSALYFIYDYHKLAVENKIQALNAMNLARENQLKLLSYQLNPHFLFNVLNSIGSMVLKYDDMPLYNTITKLSDFLRYTLESKPWEKVTLQQEVECAQQYLDIQKVRFKEKLSLTFDVPDELLSIKLPSLILLPLIENVIKHTIAKSAKHVKLLCRVSQNHDGIIILIENSIEISTQVTTKNSGIGLTNVKERLMAYYDGKASLNIQIEENKYKASLYIPLPNEDL